MTSERRPHNKRHPDDSYVDELRIITRERYKTSGLSGDEWRFHRVLQVFRKGVLLFERAFNGDVCDVVAFAPLAISEGMEGQYARVDDANLCFQPGCANVATSEYEIIEEFGPQGQRLHPEEQTYHSARRKFCQKHLRRGDCGREDADDNYRVVSGYGPDQQDWDGANKVEALRRIVKVESVEQIPDAVKQVMDDVKKQQD